MLKKFIYTGIGIASITNDKLKELLEDLIQNNQFTEEEGERLVDEFLINLRTQIDSVQNVLLFQTDKFLTKWNLSSIYDIKDEILKHVNTMKENSSLIVNKKSY